MCASRFNSRILNQLAPRRRCQDPRIVFDPTSSYFVMAFTAYGNGGAKVKSLTLEQQLLL